MQTDAFLIFRCGIRFALKANRLALIFLPFGSLLRVFHAAEFADDVDFDLSGIFEFLFDLFRYVLCK